MSYKYKMNNFPHIIHQIWLQGQDNIPEKYHKNIEQNIKHQQSWEYILWDDIKIINLLRNQKEWIDTYYKLEYLHHKVDFARYIILYVYGGAYIDMDAKIIKPLDAITNQFNNYDLIISKVNSNILENYIHCGYNTCFNNGILIAKKNNIILKKMIESVINEPKCSNLSTKITCIQTITGPRKFTKIIHDNMNNKIKILDPEYLEPCVLDVCTVTNNTHIIHNHEGTWYSSNLRDLAVIYLQNKWSFYFCFLIILIIFIKYFYY